MSRYQFNLEALKRNYPNLAEQVDKMPDDRTVQVLPTKLPGMMTAKIRTGTTDWLLHSRDNPREEAFNFVNTMIRPDIQYANIMVILGIGMGYYVEPLFMNYFRENTLFILIENNMQLFKKYIENQQPTVSEQGHVMSMFDHKRCSLMVGVPPQQVYSYLFDIMMKMGRNAHSTFYFVEHPVLIRFNKEYYKPVCGEIARVCYDIRSSYGNDPEDSWIGADHMLQNLDTIVKNPGVGKLERKFEKKPAVIVATGPSLNKNIHLLPKIKNKAVFMAADASLNTFFNQPTPIIPDIVSCLERNESTANHFNQISDAKKELMKDIWLCACPVVMPCVYEAWKGKNAILYRDFAHFRWLGVDKGILNTGKSVTNMAFKLAEYMGCDPIVLVGQDLAFAPFGDSHVKGANHARDGLKRSQLMKQQTQVMGNDGTMLKSLDTWVGMLKRFEFDIAQSGGRYKVINATEGGARITGTEVMPLQAVIDQYCQEDLDVGNLLNQYLTCPDTKQIENDTQTIMGQIDKGLDYLTNTHRLLNEAVDTMEEAGPIFLADEPSESDMQDVFNYCNKVKQEVLTHEMCYFTAMHIIQSWCMGRENIFHTIEEYYKGRELNTARFIKIFELFYGLRKLYRMLEEGVQEDYTKWKVVAGVG